MLDRHAPHEGQVGQRLRKMKRSSQFQAIPDVWTWDASLKQTEKWMTIGECCSRMDQSRCLFLLGMQDACPLENEPISRRQRQLAIGHLKTLDMGEQQLTGRGREWSNRYHPQLAIERLTGKFFCDEFHV